MTRIAIFASGAGSNAQKIIEYFSRSQQTSDPVKRPIEVALIVCNKPEAGVLKIAARENINTLLIEKERFFRGDGYVSDLRQQKIDFIALA